MAARTAASKRVMFLHGLESGPNGSKAQYLREHFELVSVPDLQMSVFDITRANSAIRNLMSLQRSMEGCIDVALGAIAEAYPDDTATGATPRDGGTRLTEAQAQAVRESLVLVGSSWGGALALKLLERGVRPHHTVLLAPALSANGWLNSVLWPKWSPASLPEDGRDVTLYHGDGDATVPIEGSRDLSARFPHINYNEIAGGDHRLNDAMLKATAEYPTGRLGEAVKKIVGGNASRL